MQLTTDYEQLTNPSDPSRPAVPAPSIRVRPAQTVGPIDPPGSTAGGSMAGQGGAEEPGVSRGSPRIDRSARTAVHEELERDAEEHPEMVIVWVFYVGMIVLAIGAVMLF